jgi:c(7)-type cytochrome triheme protein
MVDIEEGRYCGTCHDGETAFATTITNCGRCHVPDSTPRTGG